MSLPRFALRLIAFRILPASVNVTEDKRDGVVIIEEDPSESALLDALARTLCS